MPRPEKLDGITKKQKTPCGNLYITLNYRENKVTEIFAHIGKSGVCPNVMLEAISRLSSLALRNGVKEEKVIEALEDLCCSDADNKVFLCCPHAISVFLKDSLAKSIR